MLFWRVKPLDKILETAEQEGADPATRRVPADHARHRRDHRHRHLRADRRSRAEGRTRHDGRFVIAAVVCALAALAYAEMASMVPVSGSAYTYTYAVMGEGLAWMVGWALVLEYAVAAGAVSVGWSGLHERPVAASATCSAGGPGSLALPMALRTRPLRRRQLQPAGLPDRAGGHCAAGDRHLQERQGQRGAGRDQGRRADRCSSSIALPAVQRRRTSSRSSRPAGAARWAASACSARGVDLLRLRRLRRGLHRGRGNQEPATATSRSA